MYLAKVVGRVVCTVKNPALDGHRLLVVQPVNPDGTPTGKRLVCTDSQSAGAGELVYVCRGKESSFPFLPAEVPTDNNIVGIVDEVQLESVLES